jgi:hypothetical protein
VERADVGHQPKQLLRDIVAGVIKKDFQFAGPSASLKLTFPLSGKLSAGVSRHSPYLPP